MKVFNYIVILTLFCAVCSGEEILDEENKEKDDREGKQLLDNFDHGGWKTVNPEWKGSEGWVPRDNNPEVTSEYLEKPTMRRRRIRKRKRRPPSEEIDELGDHDNGNPYTLQDTHDSWMEMEEENTHKPHNRRRIVPVYYSEELPKPQQVYEKVRDPFTALQEVEAKSRLKKKPITPESTTMPNLKALLKQTGNGLSLSEILQRKNLSLADLLKGKQQAISALTEKTEFSTEPVSGTTAKYSKTTNQNYTNTDNLFEQSTTGTSRLQSHSSSIKTYEVVTEATTEKRIFVPSYPKIIPFNYKTSTVKAVATSTPIPTSYTTNMIRSKYFDYRSKYMSLKPKLQNLLPVTSGKSNKFSSSQQNELITTVTPLKAFTIDLKDLFGYSSLTTTKKPAPTEDQPMRMVISMDGLMKENTSSSPSTKIITEKQKSHTAKNKTFDKLKPLNAREEIMEVLKDHMSRQNLARILQDRNMTIEELVAQRERGSSQIHLADIFHNQTREPEPPSEPFVGTITSYMERKPKNFNSNFEPTKNSDKPNYIKTVVDVKPLPSDSGTKVSNSVTFPTYKIAVDKILKHNEAPPFQLSVWKTLYPNLYSENVDKKVIEHEQAQVNEIFQTEVRRIEEIENTISEAVNNKLNVEFTDNSYEKQDNFMRLPGGVKSAIIASTVLVGISLLVFLTILIICKLSHKKKKRLCYSDTYSGSKIRSPILETRPKRTIRTIMNETLGRKKKLSHSYPQNISDYFWENDKKPFQ